MTAISLPSRRPATSCLTISLILKLKPIRGLSLRIRGSFKPRGCSRRTGQEPAAVDDDEERRPPAPRSRHAGSDLYARPSRSQPLPPSGYRSVWTVAVRPTTKVVGQGLRPRPRWLPEQLP